MVDLSEYHVATSSHSPKLYPILLKFIDLISYCDNLRICASLGLRMKHEFQSDEEKHSHHFDLPLF